MNFVMLVQISILNRLNYVKIKYLLLFCVPRRTYLRLQVMSKDKI